MVFEASKRIKWALSLSTKHRITLLVFLTVMALSTRLLPLAISQYPFNNDSINECRIAGDILLSGHLEYPAGSHYADSQSVVTPAYNVLLAFCSAVLGTNPFSIAQVVIAILSVVTLVGIYLISMQITGDTRAAICAYFVLAFLGTFVYLTGSAWKEAAAIPLLVLLVFAYMGRSQPRMLVLEIVLLSLLPLTHHLVAVVAYLIIACMTIWSISFAIASRSVRPGHLVDVVVIGIFSLGALVYYFASSLDGFSYIDTEASILTVVVSFLLLVAAGMAILSKKTHVRYSFAWIPASSLFAMFVWNHFNPLFPYTQGEPDSVLVLGIVTSLLVGVAWFGWETLVESSSKHRMIPLGTLIPVMALLLFALISSSELSAHKAFYRTFDMADISLALGVSIAVAGMARKPRKQMVVIICLLVALLVSFPYGIATGTLVGVRHDTQSYEVDAIDWVYVSCGSDAILQSDERLAYCSRVLHDFEKNSGLPSVLAEERFPRTVAINLMLEEWMSTGVNDYPYGYHILNETFIERCLSSSNVYYVGGPASNNLWLFEVSEIAST